MSVKSYKPYEDVVTLLNKLYERVRKINLTTRITLYNAFLFLIVVVLIYFLVTVLTKQFIYNRNRDELLDKSQQIREYLSPYKARFTSMNEKERIRKISALLEDIQLFDSSQYFIFITDSHSNNSFSYKPQYYIQQISKNMPFDLKHVSAQTTYTERLIHDKFTTSTMHYELFHSFDGNDYKPLFQGHLILPGSGTERQVQSFNVSNQTLWYTTIRCDFEANDSVFITLVLTPQLDHTFLLSLRSALILAGIISLFIVFFMGKFFTRRALRPLVDLSYIAQNINNETLNYRIPCSDSNDEVDTLVKSLNLMLDSLDQSFQSQKRFVSDASHELRIPLTVMLGNIELLRKVGFTDETLLKESLEAIEEEAKNMNRLVEKLLLIARLESKRMTTQVTALEIDSFLNRFVLECQRIYPDQNFTLSLKTPAICYADKELLTQMLRALTENAIKYGEGSDVTIGYFESAKHHVIFVKDRGQGIPSHLVPNLTERFFRVASDRNRTTGGTGLGLSIVSALMKAHKGTLEIISEPQMGTEVRLKFPQKKKPLL